MQGGMIPLLGRAQQRAGLVPWLVLHRAVGKAKKVPFPPPALA